MPCHLPIIPLRCIGRPVDRDEHIGHRWSIQFKNIFFVCTCAQIWNRHLHFQWKVLCRWSSALKFEHLTTWVQQQESPQHCKENTNHLSLLRKPGTLTMCYKPKQESLRMIVQMFDSFKSGDFKFFPVVQWSTVNNLPVRSRIIEGRIVGRLKVNDSGPPALTTLLLIIIARESCQQRGAAGCRGQTLVL